MVLYAFFVCLLNVYWSGVRLCCAGLMCWFGVAIFCAGNWCISLVCCLVVLSLLCLLFGVNRDCLVCWLTVLVRCALSISLYLVHQIITFFTYH